MQGRRGKNKKGLSEIISYLLLISITLVISVGVYQWTKTYIPKDVMNCPDGTSVQIKELSCLDDNGNFSLAMTLENSGRFNIAGYFISATNSSEQELATIDLSENLIYGGYLLDNAILFDMGDTNTMQPGDEKDATFELDEAIYSVEVTPVRYQEEDNKIRFVNCGKLKVVEEVNCSGSSSGGCPTYDCDGKECGDDGCGGSCGTCGSEEVCNATGQCEINEGYDNYTKLLLHMDDVGLTDEIGHSVTLNGNVARSSAQSKFGSYSAYFDGNDDYLTIPGNADFNFGTGNFTIDTWIRPNSYSNLYLLDMSSGGTRLTINLAGQNRLYLILGSVTLDLNPPAVTFPAAGTWCHLAIVRNSGTVTAYLNGVIMGSTTASGNIGDSTSTSYLGVTSGISGDYQGYIDEFRISKGVARWTSNFSVPTSAY